MTSDHYNAGEAEVRWQQAWGAQAIFATRNDDVAIVTKSKADTWLAQFGSPE